MNEQKSIILHVSTNTFFNTLFLYAKKLSAQDFYPVMYFDNQYPTLEEDLQKLHSDNISYELDFPITFTKPKNYLRKLLLVFIKIIKRIDFFFFNGLFFELARHKSKYKKIKTIFRKGKIQYVLMISDLVQYDTGLIIKAAHKENIKVVILPLFAANYKEAAEHNYYNRSLEVSEWNFQLFFKISWLKKWLIHFKGRYMIRLPLYKIIIKELFKIAPENPWIINTGGADAMILESRAVKRLFVNAHPYENVKIEILGSVNLDIIYHSIKAKKQLINELIKNQKLDSSKRNALVAVPPDMHSSRGLKSDFSSYTDLLEFWLSCTKILSGYNIILSLHPSSTLEERYFFVDRGFNIIDKPTVMYIGLFDLYIASVSATIQWAIACGIPVINYDVYRYDYDDYKQLDAVLNTDCKQEFRNILKQLNSYNKLEILKEKQSKIAGDWGILDGNSSLRIVNFFARNLN
jgi:hypothetical protein